MNVRDRIMQEVNKCLDNARRLFPNFTFCPTPTVTFYTKGRAAGWAHGYSCLRFNEYVLGQDDATLVNVVSHEIAHIVCAYTGLGKGHNAGWKRVHRMLGGTAERCYNHDGALDVKPARVQRKYEHRATCGTIVKLSAIRHKRIMQGGGMYTCSLTATGGKLTRETFTGRVI